MLPDLVTRFQSHKCNKYCTKSFKRNGQFYKKCWFGFLRPVKEQTEINDVIECLAVNKTTQQQKRFHQLQRNENEVAINDCSAALMLASQSNVDIQYIGHVGSKLPYCITSYIKNMNAVCRMGCGKKFTRPPSHLVQMQSLSSCKLLKVARLEPTKLLTNCLATNCTPSHDKCDLQTCSRKTCSKTYYRDRQNSAIQSRFRGHLLHTLGAWCVPTMSRHAGRHVSLWSAGMAWKMSQWQ